MTNLDQTRGAPSDPDTETETAKFAANAAQWWDPDGPLRTLHQINPLRLDFVQRQTGPLDGLRAADIGCGGGILSEALAGGGARVTGIDLAEPLIEVAKTHARDGGIAIDYRCCDSATLASAQAATFDLVCCMELLEHVTDPQRVIGDCATLLKPGGVACFATINRNPRAYLESIVAGEYLLGLLPRGTHDYGHYIRPSELAAACRRSGLELCALSGMRYAPLTGHHRLTSDVGVNYLLAARRGR